MNGYLSQPIMTGPNPVVQASYQDGQPSDAKSNPQQPPAQLSSSGHPDNSKRFVYADSHPESIQFLADASKQIATSLPMGASIELTGNLFGQVVTASGNYYQMGQGSHKSRTELRFGTHPNSPTVIQLCDGRFAYKFQSSGTRQTMEVVDLERVRRTAGESPSEITPTGWVASGGIASLFQHLASAFNFGAPQWIDDSNVVLRGCWDENAIRQITAVSENEQALSLGLAELWELIPPQLPHAVELTFRKDRNDDFFPKRIKFLQFANPAQPESAPELTPMVVLEFSTPKRLSASSDRYFAIDSTDLDLVDMTDQYIARIETFDERQQTASAPETVDR